MKQLEDYFDEKLADILEQDQERWDTKYMPSVDNLLPNHYHTDIDDFVGYTEDNDYGD